MMWQFSESVDGLSQALDAFGIPCIGGNVSLYNGSDRAAAIQTSLFATFSGRQFAPDILMAQEIQSSSAASTLSG